MFSSDLLPEPIAPNALTEKRERTDLAQIFEQSPAFMAILRGPRHVYEMTNPTYSQMIGYRDVLGKPLVEALPEIADQGVAAILDHVFQTGIPYTAYEATRLIGRTAGVNDGEESSSAEGGSLDEITVDLTYQPFFDTDNAVSGILIQGVDRTQRKRQERESQAAIRALNLAEERLRLATTSANIGTWDLDPVENVLFWDAQCRAAFGYPLDRPVDYSVFLALLHDEDRERTDKAVQTALAPDGAGEYVVEYRTVGFLDGVVRWVRAEGKALFDASHEQAVRFIGTIRDISDTKNVEQQLVEAQQRLEAALSAGDIATWTFDIRSNRVVADINLARLFSVNPEDAAGGELGVYLAAIVEEDRPRVIETINRAIESESHYEAEYRVALPDGAHRWLSARGTVERDADGQALALPGVIVDISERVERDRRKRFFTELMVSTRGILDPEEILFQTAKAVGEYTHADRALYAEINDETNRMTIRRDFVRADAGVTSRTGIFDLSTFGAPLMESLRDGVVTQVFDIDEDSRLTSDGRTAFRAARLRSFLALPVLRAGRLVAILALQQTQPRAWTPEEAELLQAAVERTWLAVENARLFRETQTRAEHETILNQISAAARGTLEPEVILQSAVELVGRGLRADRCYFSRSDQARDTVRVAPEWRRENIGLESFLGRPFRFSAYAANRDSTYQTGHTHVVNDVNDYGLADAAPLTSINIRALLRVPIEIGDQMTALSVAMAYNARQWTRDEIRLVENAAALVRAALESAHLQQRERNISQQLQEALIPPPPTDLPGMALASFYRPALGEAEVGGDFFDVFPIEAGCTALVVADLSGKGLAAASQVATVRNMLRYAVYAGATLAEAVTGLHRTLVRYELLSGFATLFVGVYDEKEQSLAYVNCGQEPGLIWRPTTGGVEHLTPTGPVLGGFGDGNYGERTVRLGPGDILALFTDGLTEVGPTRKVQLEVSGVSRVLRDCCDRDQSETRRPGDIVECLIADIDDFARGGARDDIALLVGVVKTL